MDWADRESVEAKVRTKIKRLLRRHKYEPPTAAGSGGELAGFDYAAQLVLDQAKSLYRYWPDVDVGDQLFASR